MLNISENTVNGGDDPALFLDPRIDCKQAAILMLWESYGLIDDAIAKGLIALALRRLAAA